MVDGEDGRPRVICRAGIALLLACAPLTALAQGRPAPPCIPEPFVQRDVCPFECCHYGPWVAQTPFRVYDAARPGARVVTTLRKGAGFHAERGEIHFARVGRVVLAQRLRLDADDRDTVWVAPRDTVTILSYEGEGFYDTWNRGRIYSMEQFWSEPGDKPRVPPAAGSMVRVPDGQWWVRVRLRDGRRGWIRAGEFDVRGADACE